MKIPPRGGGTPTPIMAQQGSSPFEGLMKGYQIVQSKTLYLYSEVFHDLTTFLGEGLFLLVYHGDFRSNTTI